MEEKVEEKVEGKAEANRGEESSERTGRVGGMVVDQSRLMLSQNI